MRAVVARLLRLRTTAALGPAGACTKQAPLACVDLPQPRLGLVQRQPLEHGLPVLGVGGGTAVQLLLDAGLQLHQLRVPLACGQAGAACSILHVMHTTLTFTQEHS